jgi:tRNA-Thr(GGU) m(6)t(6)A37 methyltransferase TsaA
VNIEYRPIGVVHSPFKEKGGTPTQPSRSDGARGSVEIFPEFAEGLSDLDGFSHVILLCHLDRSTGWRPMVVPHLETETRGVFATRSPARPNPIGLSVVRLIAVEGATLTIEGLDLLDGTPVLDIKPFVGDLAASAHVRYGWLESARERRNRSEDKP